MKKELIKGAIFGAIFGIYTVVMAYANLTLIAPDVIVDLEGVATSWTGALTILITYVAIGTVVGLIMHYVVNLKKDKK